MKLQKISTTFRHIFIPHEGNDYKPHFFRELAVAILLIVAVFLLGVSAGSSLFLRKTVLGASITASVLVDLANETRLAYNESPLVRNPLLDKAAELKGLDMSTRGYFSHDSPEGVTPWHWFKQVGYTFLYAGENLAVNFSESGDVQNAWLNSPKHKENLLNKNFKEVGIGTVEGVYKNNPTIFVVQMFGTPASAKAVVQQEDTVISKETPTEPAATATPTTVAIADLSLPTNAPEVKGEESTTPLNNPKVIAVNDVKKEEPSVEKIMETDELIIVKNLEDTTPLTSTTTPVTYAPWYGKFLFGGSDYVDTLYKILIAVVLLALLAMILIEIKRQHYKHISYGVLVLIVLSILLFINKAFIS